MFEKGIIDSNYGSSHGNDFKEIKNPSGYSSRGSVGIGSEFTSQSRVETPATETHSGEAYQRGLKEGQRRGYEVGYDDGTADGWNQHARATRKPELTPEETAQAEKIRLLNRLIQIDLPYDTSLVLERTQLEHDAQGPITYFTDIALGLDGIRRFLRMRIDGMGDELETLTSNPVPVVDYPKYSGLADAAIDKFIEKQTSKK